MKPNLRSKFLIAITWSCIAASSPSASAETLSFSGTGTVRMLASDWAGYIGGSGSFNAGANDWGRLYWRGSAGDGQYIHFDLTRLTGLTVSSDASVTLQNANPTWGGGVDGSFIATANSAWTAGDNAGIPGAAAIGDAINATGSYGSGASVTWSVGGTTFQGFVDNASSFNGLAIIGGSGSQLHFTGPTNPYLEVATDSPMSNVVTVAGGATWNASNYSFTNGVLTVNDVLAGGTSGAGAVTINSLGTVFVDGNSGDNRYWDIDSSTINTGGVLVIEGHSHLHNVTLAGGELAGIRPNGTWGGWTLDDATSATGGVISTISAQRVNLDNGNLTVDSGSTLNFSGSIRSGSIIKNGGGTLRLTSDGMGGRPVNTQTGTTVINGGTVEIYGRSADNGGYTSLGTGAVTIQNGGTLVSANDWTTGNEWNGGNVGTITVNAGGTWTINTAGNTVRNGLVLNGGNVNGTGVNGDWGGMYLRNTTVTAGGNAVSSISVDTALNSNTVFTVEGGSQLNYSGTLHNRIVATGGVNKDGAGTLVLSGNNTYTGITVFSGGILNAASFANNGVASSLGNGTGDGDGNSIGLLFRGGTLQYTGSTAQSTNRHIRLSTTGGGGTIDASGSTPSATLSFTATTPVNLFENAGNRTLTLTGTNTGDNTFGTSIGEAGGTTSLVKSGPGKWLVTAANSYTGSTTVSEGTLSLGDGAANSNLADSSMVDIGIDGVLHLNFTGSDEIGRLVIDGVDQGNGTFSSLTHPGVITGSGSLVVQANDGLWISSSDGNWSTQANWDLNKVASGEDKTATFNGATGTVVTLDSSRMIGNLNFSALDYTINGSTTLTLANTSGTSSITVAGAQTATIATGVAGTVVLDKLGTGTLALTGPISYSGGTTVTAGTLALPDGDWVTGNPWGPGGATGAIIVGSGATLSTSAGVTEIKNGITLNGGTISSRGLTYSTAWGNLFLSSNIIADGAAVSSITSQLTLTGNRYITVETGSTLNISGKVSGWNHPGTGLGKIGQGSLALSATNDYTGNTSVQEGTLILGDGTNNSNLADGADVIVDTGATLNLNFSGTDTIDELWLGGVQMSPGTYTSTHPSGLITGTGALVVTNGPISDPFLAWIDATWPGLSDKTPAGDPDNDGIANLVEYVLQGGDPSVSNPGILPVLDASGANFVFTFHRRADSTTDTTQVFQYGGNLTGWTSVPVSNGGQVSISSNTPSSGIDEVVITIPKDANTSLFGRLQVTK